MFRLYTLLLIISLTFGQDRISFVRFYLNEQNYRSDIRLMASERHGQPYIQVFYNDLKMPIIKEWIDQQGETNKKEVLGYKGKKLIRRYFLNINQEPDSLIQFGKDMETPIIGVSTTFILRWQEVGRICKEIKKM